MPLGEWMVQSKWRMAFVAAIICGGAMATFFSANMSIHGIWTVRHFVPMTLLCLLGGWLLGLIIWLGLNSMFPRQ